MSIKIVVPYKFTPRSYQMPLFHAMDNGYRHAVLVWSRRTGKDKTCWNIMIKKALERVGLYFYVFPTSVQGRKVLWEGMDNEGFRFLDHIPNNISDGRNVTEMKIRLKNGSIIQIVGSDNPDSIRGTNPVGIVFSEFGMQNPIIYDITRPILVGNNGWLIINSTPFGPNHFYDLYQIAQKDPVLWFSQFLTCEDAVNDKGERYITDEMIEQERKSGMAEDMVRREFYCDFNPSASGSYYAEVLKSLETNGHIGNVPHDPKYHVYTAWDIGVRDSTVIWFYQIINSAARFIDYFEDKGKGIEYYIGELKKKPYLYADHYGPHDLRHPEFGTGKTIVEIASNFDHSFVIVPKVGLIDGINAVRATLPVCYFDKDKCSMGIKALWDYHKKWDDKNQMFKDEPDHNWASHAADAFKTFVLGYKGPNRPKFRSWREKLRQRSRSIHGQRSYMSA